MTDEQRAKLQPHLRAQLEKAEAEWEAQEAAADRRYWARTMLKCELWDRLIDQESSAICRDLEAKQQDERGP